MLKQVDENGINEKAFNLPENGGELFIKDEVLNDFRNEYLGYIGADIPITTTTDPSISAKKADYKHQSQKNVL